MDRRAFLKTSLAAGAGAVLASHSNKAMAGAYPSVEGAREDEIVLDGNIAGQMVVVVYDSMQYNMPNSYGNVLALWQNTHQVPYGQPPLSQSAISINYPGSQIIELPGSIQLPLIIGYATSSDLNTVCSTLTFYPERASGWSFSTKIHTAYINADSLVFHYQTPPGNKPATNENWVGLWRGRIASYDGSGMIAKAMVESDANDGTVAINNLPMQIGGIYTAAYFIGPKNTDIAATATIAIS
jgi:hypothetical protein